MKTALAFLLFVSCVYAQSQSDRPMAACGSENVSFKVTLNDKPQTQAPIAPGKARVYFIHDAAGAPSLAYPTIKYGVDGDWVGANRVDSWFAIEIDPGVHHICTRLQSSLVDTRAELAHFTAEAGKDYYFRTRLVMSREVDLMELEQIDSDQGRYLVGAFALSQWKSKHEDDPALRPGRR